MEAIVLDQIAILLTGVIAVWLTQDKRESWRRWAPIFGLLAQPFWFYAAWKAEQWGDLCDRNALHLRMGKRRLETLAQVGTHRLSFHPNCSGLRAECRQSGLRGVRLVALCNGPQRVYVALDVPCGVMDRA
jgi:hypothetical protein